jgi:tetratricopeptide (TPR) repeat protein
MKFKSHFLCLIKILVLFIILFPSLALPKEQYKASFEKAQSLDKDKFFKDALIFWEKTLDTNPPQNIILYTKLKLSNTYARLGKLDKAIEISRKLTESNIDNYDVWFHLANSLAASKQYLQAVEAFKKTTILKPNEGLSRVGLAFAYFGDQKPDLAIKEFRIGMKIFKTNKNISWYRDCRLAINQIKGFARFPPNFANLWLEKNLELVQNTYLDAVLDLDNLLN